MIYKFSQVIIWMFEAQFVFVLNSIICFDPLLFKLLFIFDSHEFHSPRTRIRITFFRWKIISILFIYYLWIIKLEKNEIPYYLYYLIILLPYHLINAYKFLKNNLIKFDYSIDNLHCNFARNYSSDIIDWLI